MEITVEIIEQLAEVLSKHKLDKIKLGELEITKSKHDIVSGKDLKSQASSNNLSLGEEDLLFYSSSAPALTAEQIQDLAINPMPIPETSKRSKKKDKLNG